MKDAEGSILQVEEAILEFGATGIIGHEQGATIAALVAARSILGEGVPLKFAVLCGAAMPPAGSACAALLQRMSDSNEQASIPTLHCVSKNGVPPEPALEVAACFGDGGRVLWHERGAAMPSRSWWEETEGFPEKAIGGNKWVTQYGPAKFYDAKDNYFRSEPGSRPPPRL